MHVHLLARRSARVRAAAGLLASLTLLLSACASTAQIGAVDPLQPERGGVPGATDDGSRGSGSEAGVGGTGAPDATSGGGPAAGSGDGSAAVGPTGRSAGAGTTGSTRSTDGAGMSPRVRVTSGKPIRLGYTIVDTSGAAAIAGATNYNADQQTQASRDAMKALIRHANQTGGVGGRRIDGFETTVHVSDAFNESAMLSRCASATEDDKVEIMIDTDAFSSQNALACFGKHRTPLINIMFNPPKSLILRYRPYLATTFGLPENTMRAMVDGLHRAGYFKGAVVGAIVDDEETIRRVYRDLMTPMLRRIGVRVVSTRYMTPLDPGQQAAQAQNAVLDFKSRGVTHVISGVNVLNLIAFANAEQSQDYYMKLGLGDYQIAAAAGAGNSPYVETLRRAMVGAIGVSVAKRLIQDRPAPSGSRYSKDVRVIGKAVKRCLDVLSQQLKVDYYELSNNARGRGFLSMCDHFFLWLDTARRIGAGVTQFNWGLELPQLGTSYESTTVGSTRFARDKYDGAELYRVGRYFHENAACACYQAVLRQFFAVPR